jgi:hypothetical protein
MAWVVFTTLASLASIFGMAFQLYKNKEKPLTYVLLTVAIFCSVLSAILWVQSSKLSEENTNLKLARIQADQLLGSWPKKDKLDFVSAGEFRGIVISGMAFLEANKDIFPETYRMSKKLLFSELEVGSKGDENYITKRSVLQEAAETMLTTINSVRLLSK